MKKLEIGFCLSLALFATTARADIPMHAPRVDSPELVALRAKSKAQALGTQQLPTLSRRVGIGNQAMADKLSALLPDMGLSAADIANGSKNDVSGTLLIVGKSWSLHTSGDGRHGRAWLDPVNLPGIDINARMSYDQVVTLGQSVLYGKLAAIIGIASSEKLPVRYVSYTGKFAVNAIGITVDSQVLVSYASFGRLINGVPVVGSGSFVKVGFDATGRLVSVDFDWSAYDQTSSVESTAGVDAINARFSKLGGTAQGVSVNYEECGYYDPGVQSHAIPSLLQPACLYSVKNGPSISTISVPAGSTYSVDVAWPETQILLTQ